MHIKLIKAAMAARGASYSPYSAFRVGAALLAQNGEIFVGCNVEIGGYGATCCAERIAIFKAVSHGVRHFTAIAIVGGPDDGPVANCFPCGICRQALAEFCDDNLKIIVAENEENYREFTLGQLFPHRFAEL